MKTWKNTSAKQIPPLKKDITNHKRDCKHQKYCTCTKLAKYLRELKEKNITPIIKWGILNKVYGNPEQKMCILYLTEKFWITNFKKTELINKCTHINKFSLKNVKRWIWQQFYIVWMYSILENLFWWDIVWYKNQWTCLHCMSVDCVSIWGFLVE